MVIKELIGQALQSSITLVLVRCIAVVLAFGASVHVANILGYGERPWAQMPAIWRVMDVVLLIFNLVVGIGLWLKTPWAVIAFVAGVVALQLVPYTLFRSHFIETPEHASTLNGMVIFWIIVLAVLIGTVIWRGTAS